MKRRTFIEALAATGTLGLPTSWTLAESEVPAPRHLVPLYEQIAAVRASVPPPIAPSGPFQLTDLDTNLYPLVIGLGPAAESLVTQIHGWGIAPVDAGLYHAGGSPQEPSATVSDELALRLRHCASALLLIDGRDPHTLLDSLAWARRLEAHDVNVRAALVMNPVDTPLLQAWRSALRESVHGVLELRTWEATLDPADVVQTLLYGLPFFTPSLVEAWPCDTREVLQSAPQSRTTAIRWHQGEVPIPSAVAGACLPLMPPRQGVGALAWLHGGNTLTLAEFDAVAEQLGQHLTDEARMLLGVVHRNDWHPDHRALSLTLVGDWAPG